MKAPITNPELASQLITLLASLMLVLQLLLVVQRMLIARAALKETA